MEAMTRPRTQIERRRELLSALRHIEQDDFTAVEWLAISQRVASVAPKMRLPDDAPRVDL